MRELTKNELNYISGAGITMGLIGVGISTIGGSFGSALGGTLASAAGLGAIRGGLVGGFAGAALGAAISVGYVLATTPSGGAGAGNIDDKDS